VLGSVEILHVELDGAVTGFVQTEAVDGMLLDDAAELAALAEGYFETSFEDCDDLISVRGVGELEEEGIVGVDLADEVIDG